MLSFTVRRSYRLTLLQSINGLLGASVLRARKARHCLQLWVNPPVGLVPSST